MLDINATPGERAIDAITPVLRRKDDFLVCGHVRPDGDCIGSQLALYYLLKQMGKRVAMLNPGPILDHYRFLPGIEEISDKEPSGWIPAVYIFVDCSDTDRVRDDFRPQGFIINIDHHTSNNYFGDINYVDDDAAAVGEQIYRLAIHLAVKITPEMATSIYLAVLADTGSFRFSNTTSHTFRVVAELVKAGADPRTISQEFYENKKPESVRLSCDVLHIVRFEFGGKLAWGEITQEMYRTAGGEINEPEGLVSDIRSMRGVEIAVLIHELREGGLRVAFRSKGHRDVSEIAKQLGGGGHVNAAGCFIKGDYETLKKKVLDTVRAHVLKIKSGDQKA